MEKIKNDVKKEYLLQYRVLKGKQKRLEEAIMELRLNKMFPSVTSTGMPISHNIKDLSDYMAAVDTKLHECLRNRYVMIEKYTQIQQDIELILEEDERAVLFYRYLKGESWSRIADRLNTSERNIYRLHGKALNNFIISEKNI